MNAKSSLGAEGFSARLLRERESYRWGPWPWDEADASEPKVEVTKAELDALLDVLVEAECLL